MIMAQIASPAKPGGPPFARADDGRAATTAQVELPDAHDDVIAKELDRLMHHYGNDQNQVFRFLSEQKLSAGLMEHYLAVLRRRFALPPPTGGPPARPAVADPSTHTYDAYQSNRVPECQDCQEFQESHESHVAAAPKTPRRRGARRKPRKQDPGADRKPSATTLAADLAADLFQWEEPAESEWMYPVRVPFLLARRLRQLGDVDPDGLRPVAVAFWKQTEELDGSEMEFDEFWVAFLDCWDKVQFAEGEDPFSWAATQATENPLPANARAFPSSGCRAVASLAAHLYAYQQGEAFALPQGRIAEWLQCGQQAVSRILSLLVRRGVLEVADENYVRGKKAKEYRFISREKGVSR
jgi:hypothetical protein